MTARARISSAPDIPTADEAGLPGFYVPVWNALWAPKRTPQNIIAKLNAAVVEALADPGVRARLTDLGQEIFPREQQTPGALRAGGVTLGSDPGLNRMRKSPRGIGTGALVGGIVLHSAS